MASGEGAGPSRGANGGSTRGSADGGPGGSREQSWFFVRGGSDEEIKRMRLRVAELGEQIAPLTTQLCSAEKALRAANFGVVIGQEGTQERRAAARAHYNAVYEQYLAACAAFVPKP